MMGQSRIGFRRGDGSSSANWITFCLALALWAASLAGCNLVVDDRDDPPPVFTVQVTSDVEADGDIGLTLPASYTISSALDTGNILAGIDPESGDEFRGFLNFPLRGKHGVPLDAVIESATLDIFISGMSISPSDRFLPFLFDLVAFQPPALITDDFDRGIRPSLLTLPFDFYPSDVGAIVIIDVTSLMDQAQAEGLPDFQLRLLLDFSATSGLIEIDDSDFATAPLLTVSYF